MSDDIIYIMLACLAISQGTTRRSSLPQSVLTFVPFLYTANSSSASSPSTSGSSFSTVVSLVIFVFSIVFGIWMWYDMIWRGEVSQLVKWHDDHAHLTLITDDISRIADNSVQTYLFRRGFITKCFIFLLFFCLDSLFQVTLLFLVFLVHLCAFALVLDVTWILHHLDNSGLATTRYVTQKTVRMKRI